MTTKHTQQKLIINYIVSHYLVLPSQTCTTHIHSHVGTATMLSRTYLHTHLSIYCSVLLLDSVSLSLHCVCLMLILFTQQLIFHWISIFSFIFYFIHMTHMITVRCHSHKYCTTMTTPPAAATTKTGHEMWMKEKGELKTKWYLVHTMKEHYTYSIWCSSLK